MIPRLRSIARSVGHSTLSRLPTGAGARAEFVTARWRLDAGEAVLDVEGRARRLLARADAAHARGLGTEAVDWADKALQLLYHPTVHYGTDLSPFADPELGLLSPLRESTVGRLLLQQPDRGRPSRPGGPRVLFLVPSSWSFVNRLMSALADRTDVEVRVFDLETLPPEQSPSRRGVLEARFDLATTGRRLPVPEALREDMEWADTIFFEWAAYPFAWFSMFEDTGARTVVRLHRYEAFTPYPQLADMASMDQVLFVSEHMRSLVEASTPRLEQAHAIDVVANVHDFTQFSADKEPGYERTILQVGWAKPVKDVLFTMDVLEQLLTDEPSWRLLLAGAPFSPEVVARSDYAQRVLQRIEKLGGAVEVLGFQEDMPQTYRRAGFLISSSRHEGVHEAIGEGAAAGCLPVVRNWPENRSWGGGVSSLYPAPWIVQDPAAAAERIRAHAQRDVLDAARGDAREWLLAWRDPDVALEDYLRALFGGAHPPHA